MFDLDIDFFINAILCGNHRHGFKMVQNMCADARTAPIINWWSTSKKVMFSRLPLMEKLMMSTSRRLCKGTNAPRKGRSAVFPVHEFIGRWLHHLRTQTCWPNWGGWGIPDSKSAPLAAFATVCPINPWQTRAWYLSWEHHSILERSFDFAKDIHVDQAANERLLLQQVMATEGDLLRSCLGPCSGGWGSVPTHEVNAKTLSRALTEASDCAPALGLSWIIARLGRHLIGVHDTRRFMWHLWRFAAIWFSGKVR